MPNVIVLALASVLMLQVYHVEADSGEVLWNDGRAGSQQHKISKRKDLDPQTCVENFVIHRDKIIRTEDSREMGAKYLNEIELGSREECLRLCCETEECDVFVFEEKSPGSCYLFRCGPPEDFKCKFTRHVNFTSAVLAISRRLAELEDQIRLTKHEQELASLRTQVQEEQLMARGREMSAAPKPHMRVSLPSTTLVSTPSPAAAIQKQIATTTVTVRRCSRYQFECHGSGECIAIYNACDGVPQCADGSDEAAELGCPAAAAPTTEAPAATARVPPAPGPRRPLSPPKEILPPPQSYDSSDEPIIQKGQSESRQPFMRPGEPEPVQWPNRLSQMQPPVPPMQMKPYEDDRRSKIFNHKGGLQVTEAESAAASQYEYKGIPYESMSDSAWQHRQWAQNPDQMATNVGQPIFHIESESLNPWKKPSEIGTDIDQRRLEAPHMNEMPPQIMEKYDRSGDDYMNKNKMWPVPQPPPIKTMAPQRYPDVMLNSPQQVYMTEQDDINSQHDHKAHETIQKKYENSGPIDDSPTDKTNTEERVKIKSHAKQKTPNGEQSKQDTYKSKEDKSRAHLKDDISYETENEEDIVKEASIIINHKKIGQEEEEDDHDGLSANPPGAIVILIIGLFMTGTMVVMICWRARVGRRRRRGSKGGFAHDSDYLVNGMYL